MPRVYPRELGISFYCQTVIVFSVRIEVLVCQSQLDWGGGGI